MEENNIPIEYEAERRGYEKGKEETEINTIGELMVNNSPLKAPEGVVYLATYLQGFNRATELLVGFYGLSNEELSKGLRNYFKLKLLEEE